jgi:hypothetical protein
VIRILNGMKLKPLAIDVVKAKEAELGKAAAGRLQRFVDLFENSQMPCENRV